MTRPRIGITTAAFLLLATCGSGAAMAGSVFLKNGYILQGRIVERGDGVVVLGWQNGRVTIHDRFIDEVLLDPAEEELIRRQKELAEAEAAETALAMENFDLASNEVISLPDTYESILGSSATPATTAWTPGSGPTTTPASDPSQTPVPQAGTLPNPAEMEKIFPALGVALQVPSGWKIGESADALQVERAGASGAVKFTIDLWRSGTIENDVAIGAIAESLAAAFPNAAVESGAELDIAGFPAKSLVCRDSDRRTTCRQHVVATENGVYVVGMYFPFETDTASALALDDVLDSLRFLFE